MIPTSRIRVCNYPPEYNTFSYIIQEKEVNGKIVESEPIYFYDLTSEERTLAIIIGEAQYSLNKLINKYGKI